MVPVLFIMHVPFEKGKWKMYLYRDDLSAYPDEKEYLLSTYYWSVSSIKEKTMRYQGEPFKVHVVTLKTFWSKRWLCCRLSFFLIVLPVTLFLIVYITGVIGCYDNDLEN